MGNETRAFLLPFKASSRRTQIRLADIPPSPNEGFSPASPMPLTLFKDPPILGCGEMTNAPSCATKTAYTNLSDKLDLARK